MTEPTVEVVRAWHRVAGPGHDGTADALIARHSEPHRRYHTITHVMWVVRHVDELSRTEPVTDLAAVRAAALFHDIVYDPRSTTNEPDSAVVAAHHLADLGWAAERIGCVVEMIEATAGHVAVEGDTAVLLDADLSVLGSEPSAYAAYVSGVRAEYAHVDDAAWRVGRAAVLQSFLGRDRIYATATMRSTRERRARANLEAELATLR